jgi:hypothetical protein
VSFLAAGAAKQDTVFPSGEVQVCREIPVGQLSAFGCQLSATKNQPRIHFFSKPEHTITGRRGYLEKVGSVAESWQR